MRRSPRLSAVVAALVASLALPGAAGAPPPPAWWPFATGPHYGDLVPDERESGTAIVLPVGSFDPRRGALAVPAALARSVPPGERVSRDALWLVQTRRPPDPALRRALAARGARVGPFVPRRALVVRLPAPDEARRWPEVAWVGPYHPAYKIDPWIGAAFPGRAAPPSPTRFLLRAVLFDPRERAATRARLAALGADPEPAIDASRGVRPEHLHFRAGPRTLLAAAALESIVRIEEVSLTGATLNAESKVVLQSGFIDNGTPMWDAGIDGGTQLVGVIDNGMDVDTQPLSHTASTAGTPGPAHRKVQAYTPYGGGDTETCAGFNGYSHGTNTAQCAVGNRVDIGRADTFEGIAHRARVLFQDIGDTSAVACTLGQLAPPPTLVPAYEELRAAGGRLANGSFSICAGYTSHAVDADQYLWDHKGVMLFFSAGNGGGIVCPATAKNAVAAGGHYQDPFSDDPYGSRGPAPGGRLAPVVMAPACDRPNGHPQPFDWNSVASIQDTDGDITGEPGKIIFEGQCGTSFASAYTMGAAALVRDYFEKGFHPSGTADPTDTLDPSGALVKAVLLASGERMTCADCGDALMNDVQGMGRVNLSRVLAIDGDARTPQGTLVVDRGAAAGLAGGESFEQAIEVTGSDGDLRVVLAWVDAPGMTLVNDLRLTVIGPDGGPAQTYHGANFAGDASLSVAAGGTADDHANPFEAVFVPAAALVAGTWTARVEAQAVIEPDPRFGDTQPFALFAAGPIGVAVREVSPPGSSQPLRATTRVGPDVTWSWEDLADPSIVYDFYRGDLGPLFGSGAYGHGRIGPDQCSLTAATTTVGDGEDGVSRYYLVGARRGSTSGSLGRDSDGAERPPAAPACP